MNNVDFVKEGFKKVFGSPDLDEPYMRSIIDVSYRQSVDGEEMGLEAFMQHMKLLKSRTKSITIEFKTVIGKGEFVFSNHLVHAEMQNGSKTVIQVIAEFRIRDGKLYYCDELTRLISGDEESRDIGSAH